MELLRSADRHGIQNDWSHLGGQSFAQGTPAELRLIQFQCIEGDARRLQSTTPEDYVPTICSRWMRRPDRSDLARLVARVRAIGYRPRLDLIVADSDLREYILPSLGIRFDGTVLAERIKEHVASVGARYLELFPDLDQSVASWSEMAGCYASDDCPPADESLVSREIAGSVDDFTRTGHFAGLPLPGLDVLRRMSELKCSLYTRQGKWLAATHANRAFVILQNESPAVLRTQMLRAGLHSERELPVIAPYRPRRRDFAS